MVDNEFGVGTTTGWHSHPGPSLMFLVDGAVTNYDSDDAACAPHTYGRGSALVDAGGTDVHMLRNERGPPAETSRCSSSPRGAARKTGAAEARELPRLTQAAIAVLVRPIATAGVDVPRSGRWRSSSSPSRFGPACGRKEGANMPRREGLPVAAAAGSAETPC